PVPRPVPPDAWLPVVLSAVAPPVHAPVVPPAPVLADAAVPPAAAPLFPGLFPVSPVLWHVVRRRLFLLTPAPVHVFSVRLICVRLPAHGAFVPPAFSFAQRPGALPAPADACVFLPPACAVFRRHFLPESLAQSHAAAPAQECVAVPASATITQRPPARAAAPKPAPAASNAVDSANSY